MPIIDVPAVAVAIRVRPKGARYDLLDATANGAYFIPRNKLGPRTGDIVVPIDPDLVSVKQMNIHVRLKGEQSITSSVFAWSSQFDLTRAQPTETTATKVVEHDKWVQIDTTKTGADILTFDDDFDPVPDAGNE
jgi:hypothetical protein